MPRFMERQPKTRGPQVARKIISTADITVTLTADFPTVTNDTRYASEERNEKRFLLESRNAQPVNKV